MTTTERAAATRPGGPTTTTMPSTTTTTTDPMAGGAGDSGAKAQPASPTTGPAASDRGATAVGGASGHTTGPGAGLALSWALVHCSGCDAGQLRTTDFRKP